MNRKQTPRRAQDELPEAEIQQGQRRSIVMDERIKRAVKQHPQRDQAKVDSVEPGEMPATRPAAGRGVPS